MFSECLKTINQNNKKTTNNLAQHKIELLPLLSTSNTHTPYEDGYTITPDVRGMSIRKAKKILLEKKFRPKFTGSGKVIWQSPSPGTKKIPGTLCILGLN